MWSKFCESQLLIWSLLLLLSISVHEQICFHPSSSFISVPNYMCDKISGTQGHLQMIQNPFVGFTSPFFFWSPGCENSPKTKKTHWCGGCFTTTPTLFSSSSYSFSIVWVFNKLNSSYSSPPTPSPPFLFGLLNSCDFVNWSVGWGYSILSITASSSYFRILKELIIEGVSRSTGKRTGDFLDSYLTIWKNWEPWLYNLWMRSSMP